MGQVIASVRSEFSRYRRLAEGAAGQLAPSMLREALDAETNSIAVVMKHVAGNLRSRWTEPFTTDGEKPDRNRDEEFVDNFPAGDAGRDAIFAHWAHGWGALEATLATLRDEDLGRTLTIRSELHTLAQALTRSLAHTAYHTGQIVQVARALASRRGLAWSTLTIPRGGSQEFNRTYAASMTTHASHAPAPTADPMLILALHDRWATRQLLDACEKLAPEQLHRKFEMGIGSLHDTLIHDAAAVRVWAETLLRAPATPWPSNDPRPVSELRAMAEAAFDLLARAAAAGPMGETFERTRQGVTTVYTRATILCHVHTHSMHHRAQCLNMLRQLGVNPLPQSSVVEWSRAGAPTA
ncbi:MAG: DinB family protein [Planctomycetota bacterium]|nr:DinB family protein [Planctomycetota bacterium]